MADCSPLPETTSYLIAQVCKLHRQTADELLNEIGLHVGQEMMLCALWDREGVTQTELGEQLGVQPATVTNGLRRLERKGLVERTPESAPSRANYEGLLDLILRAEAAAGEPSTAELEEP